MFTGRLSNVDNVLDQESCHAPKATLSEYSEGLVGQDFDRFSARIEVHSCQGYSRSVVCLGAMHCQGPSPRILVPPAASTAALCSDYPDSSERARECL